VTFVTLSNTADSNTRHRMLTAAKSWKTLTGCRCIGAADWLPSVETPLLRHHRTALARDMVLAVVDRVLSEVEEDEDFDDVLKVKTMQHFDRVDNYIAALKVLAV